MTTHYDIGRFKGRNPVVTVGIFDGVHLGHRFIIRKLKESAGRLNGESTIVTLWPHPRTVLDQAEHNMTLLNTLEEKLAMLEDEGLDHLIVIPFTKEFSMLSSCDFIKEYLVEKIGIRHLVVGFNHRFGKDREGDFQKLKDCAGQFGFGIEQVPPLEEDSGEISSSLVRKYLQEGNVSIANKLLGREYEFSGEVIGGSRLGTSIGFPTANITPDEDYKLIPAGGVYAVTAHLKGKVLQGMLNIGTRPTVTDHASKKTIEVHLLDFGENIYNEFIRIQFVDRLRDEKKFENVDALQKQLEADREKTRGLFRGRG